MKATQKLHELGQSVWLDNISRDLLKSGTLRRDIADLSLTGLTSNPTIFDHAIKKSSHYEAAIRSKLEALAATLQDDGAKSFIKSWNDLMSVISAKAEVLKKAS